MARTGTEELKQFIRDLGGLPPELRQELRPRLRAIGQDALASVKAQASWSTRIPNATRLAIGLSKNRPGIAIVVNRAKAPHARPFEHDGRGGQFRHPVFALPRQRDMVFGVERPGAFKKTKWVLQNARPFLLSGATPHFAKVDEQIGKAVDEVARKQLK